MLKSRSGQQVNASGPAVPSIELVRRRARHRLIGASVLVLAGVVGFSLLFDTQPRPISVDIPIEIPTRAAPVPVRPLPAAPETALSPPAAAQATVDEKEEILPEPAPAASAPSAPPPAPAPAPAPAAPAATAAKAPPGGSTRPDDGARAQALLEGRAPASPSPPAAPADASVRLVVQVGAFADNARAQEVRMRLERAGLKTYTHVAQTPEGRRIRVRVGPFENRQDAEKAAERVKALNLPARILTL
ncbi:MAG: SPOR domain-containing protein [Burkholderiales bacterium]|nr:MAG: SPOR domain-containing protein [Burkholderiales bacterium]